MIPRPEIECYLGHFEPIAKKKEAPNASNTKTWTKAFSVTANTLRGTLGFIILIHLLRLFSMRAHLLCVGSKGDLHLLAFNI